MSKAVLLAINAKYVHSSLAVWILAAGSSLYAELSHEVEVVEETIHRHNDDIVRRIAGYEPDVVGISAYIWNSAKLPELLRSLRDRMPDTVFVLGGPEASYNAPYWLAQGADYVLQGEGEHSFPALLDALTGSENMPLDHVPGLWRNKNGVPVHNEVNKPADTFIDPYSSAYLEALNNRIAYIETSRGCPFRCAFCLSGISKLKYSPLSEAKERLYKLSKSGAKTIKLVDRTFNCNTDRAYELFEYVIGLDKQCCFHFEVAADLFDDRTLSLLAAAPPGRIQLEAGLQSFYEPALKAVNRDTDLSKAERNILTLLNGRNIHIHLDLIAGLPMETLECFKESFDRAYALGAHTLQLGFLKLLHGSGLREMSDRMGIIYRTEPPYEIIGSPWMEREDFAELKQVENALRQTYNKGRFLSSLKYALEVSGTRPFALYRALGAAAPNHGEQLDAYTRKIHRYLAGLPGVNAEVLRDHMVCDWLGSNRGKNIPDFLRLPDKRRKQAAAIAQDALGYTPERNESMILTSGRLQAVFVDGRVPDPVTGLYKLRFVDME